MGMSIVLSSFGLTHRCPERIRPSFPGGRVRSLRSFVFFLVGERLSPMSNSGCWRRLFPEFVLAFAMSAALTSGEEDAFEKRLADSRC
jgi:hypothetical protein